MKQLLREKGILFGVFIFFYLVIEITMFKWLNFKFLPKDMFLDLLIVFGMSSLIILIKSNKWVIVYLSFIYAFALTLFLINATMYSVYFDIFTLQQLQLLGEAKDVFAFELLSISSIIAGVIISVVYLLTMIFTYKKIKIKHLNMPNYYKKAFPIFIASLLIVFTLFSSNISAFSQYVGQNNVTAFKRASLAKYGLMGYYTKEAENIMYDNTVSNQSGSEPEFIVDESTPTDYHGLLEGMNVITIMVESGQPFAINEYLTPNMYMLAHDGLDFTNNYSENKTNVSEVVSITGNYPTISFLTGIYDYDLSFSIPNRLKDTYDTSYFHDNLPSFYDRGTIMPMLGFERVYFHDDLYPGMPIYDWSGDYTLDSDTIDRIIPHLVDSEEPFYSYWCTLSTHGPYNTGPDNIEKFQNLGFTDKILYAEENGLWVNPVANSTELNINRMRYYEAAMMDLDVAIGKLLDALRDNDLLDNTLLVLYGDHDVYYHNLHLVMNNTTPDQYYEMKMYDTFMCMYNPLLNQTYRNIENTDSGDIDKFVSPYNIAPTILDLLGLTYNENLYLADSVFSDTYEVFYSNKLTGLFNDEFYSDDGSEIIYTSEKANLMNQEQFINRSQIIIERLNYINEWYNTSKTRK